jgi:hypothetical protein
MATSAATGGVLEAPSPDATAPAEIEFGDYEP